MMVCRSVMNLSHSMRIKLKRCCFILILLIGIIIIYKVLISLDDKNLVDADSSQNLYRPADDLTRDAPCVCTSSNEADRPQPPSPEDGQREPIVKMKKVLHTDNPNTRILWRWGGKERFEPCLDKEYELTEGLKVSFITTFHTHELLTDMMHTLHSVLQRSPPELLHEVILVDDNSTNEDHKEIMENYVNMAFNIPIHILRSNRSLGLIQARLLGANHATGDILVIMDCHVEVQPKWLEPLVKEVEINRKTLATSLVDAVKSPELTESKQEPGSWLYVFRPGTWKTYFSLDMEFSYMEMSKAEINTRETDHTQPFYSPSSMGTVFAISREFFFDIGAFDSGMEGWGAENIDLSVRTWLYGGRVITVPCSRVGHVERPKNRKYRMNKEWSQKIHCNYKRLVEVLWGPYKKYFYQENPEVENTDCGDISERIKVREKSKHDTKWFFNTIYPELGLPEEDGLAYGGLKNIGTGNCLKIAPILSSPSLGNCSKLKKTYWNKIGEIREPMFTLVPTKGGLTNYGVITAHGSEHLTTYLHFQGGPIIDMKRELCLEAEDDRVNFKECDMHFKNKNQQWEFTTYTQEYHDVTKGAIPISGGAKYDSLMIRLDDYFQKAKETGLVNMRP